MNYIILNLQNTNIQNKDSICCQPPTPIFDSTVNLSCVMIHHIKCITTNDRLGYINSYRIINFVAYCKTSTIIIRECVV